MKGQLIKLPKGGIFGEERKRKPIKSSIRKSVLTKPKMCAYCRNRPSQQVHHIRGVAKGGSDRKSNLIGLCGYCHHRVTVGEITNEQLKRRLGIKTIKKSKSKKYKRRNEKTLFGFPKYNLNYPKLRV
jgi:5-methylcytosine-specific restriction endonuclease McrA